MKEENKDRSELLAFLEFMSRKGLNTTAQRRIIADAFFELPGHHSLEEFYQNVQKLDPRMTISSASPAARSSRSMIPASRSCSRN